MGCAKSKAPSYDSDKITYVNGDGVNCGFALRDGKLYRIEDETEHLVEKLHVAELPKRSSQIVLIGDAGKATSSIPRTHLHIVEEWAHNAGVTIHGLDAMTQTPSVLNQAEKPGSFTIFLKQAWNVPDMDYGGGNDAFVVVEVLSKAATPEEKRLAVARSRVIINDEHPVWNQRLTLPCTEELKDLPAENIVSTKWDLKNTQLKITMYDKDDLSSDDHIGECMIDLVDAIEKLSLKLILWDRHCDPVCGKSKMPCEIELLMLEQSFPGSWPKIPSPKEQPYPKHIFMMTRGTRGDVQPFVALARGMAEQLGWLVTICTEVRWKGFVKSNEKVSKGKIQFRPSGGDTEARMQSRTAKWALESKSEIMQLAILAFSEAEFFPSSTTFLSHVFSFQGGPNPVSMLVFGLTVAQVATMISERCKIPLAGFILQPSCIPSSSKDWQAVIDIQSHSIKALDTVEQGFTTHERLKTMKNLAEHNPFCKCRIDDLRQHFGLPPLKQNGGSWPLFQKASVPMVIPMKEGTFPRPPDWWTGVHLTDFIFLRKGGQTQGSLGEPLQSFIASSKKEKAKLVLMTFSSMPVARAVMLKGAVKMVEECKFKMRLIYVGTRQKDQVPEDLEAKATALAKEKKLLEIEKADFGVLFKQIDCFIVHGGLGTTVEALRMKKPCVVTGPLLLDQRFWGSVCTAKGVGPESVHIDAFDDACVDFVNGALDPSDPLGWQKTASAQDWGKETDDGVAANVDCFNRVLEDGTAAGLFAYRDKEFESLDSAVGVKNPKATKKTVVKKNVTSKESS